ncbi:MAG TPA: ABC transporter ATP-binding protein [Holophaga sp.]|nr:ABC transporter ATP-binding protein [Holophaga sp.]
MIGQPLSISGLHKTYPGAEHPVFEGYSLEVEAGSLCAVVGVSGVGKTTLLNCVAALDQWSEGTIKVGDECVPLREPEAASVFRRKHVGLAFQQPHLLPEFTVLENLLMPLRIARGLQAQDEPWAQELLGMVGLADLAHRLPSTLSGGQAARVGLARALVRKPSLWLLDEPTGNLDPDTAEEAFQFLLRLHRELRPTTLLVTHNPLLSERCERTVRLGKPAARA